MKALLFFCLIISFVFAFGSIIIVEQGKEVWCEPYIVSQGIVTNIGYPLDGSAKEFVLESGYTFEGYFNFEKGHQIEVWRYPCSNATIFRSSTSNLH